MTDEQLQNLTTAILDMKHNLERMAEKQEEMVDDVKEIKKAVYDPEQGLYARLKALEAWKETTSKIMWLITTTMAGLVSTVLYQNFMN
jgi:predicted  nucleic acid-binding Zn-ribbon protein